MTISQASWTHGLGIALENRSWSALRQGFFTTVRPSNESLNGWVHYAIPTPVIVKDVRYKAQTALIRFATGSAAKIKAIHVYDGEKRIDARDVDLGGGAQDFRFGISGTPEVLWGTGISVLLSFDNQGPDAYAEMIGAGIDFL